MSKAVTKAENFFLQPNLNVKHHYKNPEQSEYFDLHSNPLNLFSLSYNEIGSYISPT